MSWIERINHLMLLSLWPIIGDEGETWCMKKTRSQKFFPYTFKLSEIMVGSGFRKKPIPGPDSRFQGQQRFCIRIWNTAAVEKKLQVLHAKYVKYWGQIRDRHPSDIMAMFYETLTCLTASWISKILGTNQREASISNSKYVFWNSNLPHRSLSK